MADVRRSPQAEADLQTILANLDQRNPAVADPCRMPWALSKA